MSELICTDPSCSKNSIARGYCPAHYRAARRNGTLQPLPKPDTWTLFWEKVEKDGECWAWTGHLQTGYGVFGTNRGGKQYCHRYAYEKMRAEIPGGLQIDHLCRNRRCVNPWHLEPVTQAENLKREAAAITHCPKGHEYTPENTRSGGPDGTRRWCKACAEANKDRHNEMRRRRRALARKQKAG